MNKQIILINGLKRSGKDYSASLMKSKFEELGKSVEIISFAAPMKRIIAATFGITEEQLELYKNRNDIYSVHTFDFSIIADVGKTDFRKILQNFGSEAMKPEFGDSVWADIGHKNAMKSTADIVIISDFRFDTEWQRFASEENMSYDLTSVYVQGPEKESSDTHISEQKPNIEFSAILHNEDQDETLNIHVDTLVENILKEQNED